MDAFLEGLAEGRNRVVRCQPLPAKWAEFAQHHPFRWTNILFDAANIDQVPLTPGFYCFFVGLPPEALPPVGYPMYAGKTERTLRQRFREYLREKDENGGRVHVRTFLKVFEGELYFACTPFQGTSDEVRAIETQLLDALRPSYSDLGFSADVRAARQAWQ